MFRLGICLIGVALVAGPLHAQTPVARVGQSGWIETDAGCFVWDPKPQDGEGVSWDGGCKDGFGNGSGTEIWRMGGYEIERYVGTMQHGKLNGHVVATMSYGRNLEGEWVDDLLNGHGAYTDSDGSGYDGEWLNGLRSGHGIFRWPNGDHYDGEWRNDERNGHGVLFTAKGERIEGEWKNDEFLPVQARRSNFLSTNKIKLFVDRTQLIANPFPMKNSVVGFYGVFLRMVTENDALFGGPDCSALSCDSALVVTGVGSTRFTASGENVLVAVRVIGMRPPEAIPPGPSLQFVASVTCSKPGCKDYGDFGVSGRLLSQ